MSQLRVLHVYKTYYPDTQGGLEETIRQICLGTQRCGVVSKVFALSNNPAPHDIERDEASVTQARNQIEIASCPMSFPAFKQFKQLVGWADIIHYHFPWPFADMLHLAIRPKKPTLVTYHSDVVRQKWLNIVYSPLQNWFLNSVTKIICTSPNYFATSDVLTKVGDKVDIIPIGLDENSYHLDVPGVGIEEPDGNASGFFLFVGVLRYYKGLHILLDAMKDAPFRVVIVGSGPTERELKEQAAKLELTNVTFTGFVSDEVKNSLIRRSLAIVFPSYLRSEAFGVTLLEGALHGKPLISTEVGSGTSHVNVHGETGLVVPPGSPKALRKAMDKLYRSPQAAKEMGRNARLRYQKLFTGRLMGERYHATYEQLVGRGTVVKIERGEQRRRQKGSQA